MTEIFSQANSDNRCETCTAANAGTSDALEPMLTTKEVLAFLRITPDTLYAWRSTGDGPAAHKVGKHLKFHRDDVLAFVASKRVA